MFEIIIIIGIVAILWVVGKGLIKCQGDPSWYYMGKSIDELQAKNKTETPPPHNPNDNTPPQPPQYHPNDNMPPQYHPNDNMPPQYHPNDNMPPQYHPNDNMPPQYHPNDNMTTATITTTITTPITTTTAATTTTVTIAATVTTTATTVLISVVTTIKMVERGHPCPPYQKCNYNYGKNCIKRRNRICGFGNI